MATEKRLIDANDALEQLKQAEKEMKFVTPLGCKAVDIKAVLRYIESRPTVDAVEVVWCKDCKHGELDTTDGFEWYLCHYEGGSWNKPEHFCSYGERKDDGNK